MKKPVLFAVAVATLASAISSALPAGAVNYVYNGNTYDVTTLTGTFYGLQPTLTASDNKLWGNATLAQGLANLVGTSLGFGGPKRVDYPWGPLFAHAAPVIYTNSTLTMINVLGYTYNADWGHAGITTHAPIGADLDGQIFYNSNTYATASLVGENSGGSGGTDGGGGTPVPWDISGNSIILGSITGIGLGTGLKQLKKSTSKNS
jgi:hypothetical protein